jgi:hypothetical protein
MASAAEPVHIALVLYSDGPALEGCLWRPGGARHAFTGWTGLAAALSTAIEEHAGPDGPEACPAHAI